MSAAESRTPATALEYALFYAQLGWSVVPVRPGEKLPAVAWSKFQTLPADAATIRGWFDHAPALGVGLVQGRVPSTIVLDFDGELGHATLRDLEARGLPMSVRALTPGGGVHVVLRHPGVPVATRKGVLPGMDVRGDGGFIVAPPSRHANGGHYCWDVDAHPEDVPVADCPAWLLPVLEAPTEAPAHLAEVTRASGPLGLSGTVTDGREAYMRDTVLAVVSDLYRKHGRMPSPEQVSEVGWPQYAANVDFSRPGRGRAEWDAKVAYTLNRARKGQIRGFEGLAADGTIIPTPGNPPIMGAIVDQSAQSPNQSAQSPNSPPFVLLDPRNWTTPGPPREWIVQDWIPRGVVTALYGDGGMGKSLLAQQLLTAVATGTKWVGLEVTGGAALGIMCEDDPEELHRRQFAINRALGISPTDLAHLGYVSRVGMDNVLMSFDGRDIGSLTQTFHDLEALCELMHPDLLAWDTIADGFAGNESSRPQVRQFVQNSLGRLARKFNMGVLMLGHPSVSGITSGTGTSGSTAWSNTVRSRMYLTRPEGEDVHPDARVLSRKKANYASRDAEVKMVWQSGCFLPEVVADGKEPLPEWQKITVILDMIEHAWMRGVPWSLASNAGARRLPAIIGRRSDLGMSVKVAEQLLLKWVAEGVIETAMHDTHTKQKGLQVLRRIDREN